MWLGISLSILWLSVNLKAEMKIPSPIALSSITLQIAVQSSLRVRFLHLVSKSLSTLTHTDYTVIARCYWVNFHPAPTATKHCLHRLQHHGVNRLTVVFEYIRIQSVALERDCFCFSVSCHVNRRSWLLQSSCYYTLITRKNNM